ncbi:unnamed protein product [Parajaminaea phylloscopi]
MAWRRLITFVAAEDHQVYSGEPTDASLDVGLAYAEGRPIRARVLPPGSSPLDQSPHASAPTSVERTVLVLLPPLSRKDIPSIRALGANFVQAGQDAREAKAKRPKLPIVFYKPLTSLSGPEREIVVPKAALKEGDETDWEVELGVIIGKPCKDVSPAEALDYVHAYTLTNDVSSRKRMFAVPQWGLGKSFDSFLPIGPCLVSPQALGDPEDVDLKTTINGQVVQDGNTRDHLWTVRESISELSQGTTLLPGDIISMGTPPGEGFKQNPPRFFQHGDVCVVSGGKGLGSLRNRVRHEGKGDLTKPIKAKL